MTVFEWLTLFAAPSLIFTIYELFTKFVFKKSNGSAAVKKGIQIILMRELMQDYRKYMADGSIDIMDKQIYEKMYLAYHNLGKNGVMDNMYQEVINLPTK